MVAPVTVIIPSRDRYRDLRRCLLALADCDIDLLHEVIIVDDGSCPRIDDVTVPGLRVRVIRNVRSRGANLSRTMAAAAATSPVLAFLDDDALPRPDWLSVIVRTLSPDRGGVTGRVLPFDTGLVSRARQARYLQRYESLVTGQPVPFFAGGNGAVWRDVFLDCGGMSVAGAGGDNSLVRNLRSQGRAVHFEPDLVIVHRNGKGVAVALREAFNAGRCGQHLSTRTAVSLALRPCAGATCAERSLNRLLNLAHLAGRRLAAPVPLAGEGALA